MIDQLYKDEGTKIQLSSLLPGLVVRVLSCILNGVWLCIALMSSSSVLYSQNPPFWESLRLPCVPSPSRKPIMLVLPTCHLSSLFHAFSSDVSHAEGLPSANIHRHLLHHHTSKLFCSVDPFMSSQQSTWQHWQQVGWHCNFPLARPVSFPSSHDR